ncbi:MAG: PDZ domain-containing protein, partial [Verrucomicrobiota bacterium]
VIGTQSAFVSQDKIGLGIALSAAPDAIERLVKTKKSAETPSVGTAFEELWTQPVGFISRFPEGTRGMVPVLPTENGPAQKAGLMGDVVITQINGIPLTFRDTLLEILRTKKPNDEVEFTVLRPDGGTTETIKVTISTL